MNTQTSLDTNKNSYVAFDATSLRDLIVSKLNKDSVFTDQNYVGSNISSIIEIISYSFSTLMFYLNKTSTESMFSEAQLYENINRIVKLLDYNPMGCQTASTSFSLSAQNLDVASYTIPRYSYINVGGIAYSFATDVSFAKTTTDAVEAISDIENIYRLYQGRYFEYPTYTATGTDNELVVLSIDDTVLVDHLNLDVYIRDYTTNVWTKWTRVDNLFSYTSRDRVFEARLNEFKRYEFKFGDGINGRKLNAGDLVSIFYLQSSGTDGEVGTNALLNSKISKYNSPYYNEILSQTAIGYINILPDSGFAKLLINNTQSSTKFATYEDASSIRARAPKVHKTQGRLVTSQDYISFILANHYNIISDVVVKNNEEYLAGYIQYLYNIGISSPQLESRVLYNQVTFANSCNFNNIYVIALPRIRNRTYLAPSQKEAIITSMLPYKTITSDVIVVDPVYVAVDVAVKSANQSSLQDIDNTETIIVMDRLNRRGINAIRADIRAIFESYFSVDTFTLGALINVYQIYADILNISGVTRVFSRRKDTNAEIEGISLIAWNPVYPSDITITTQNIALPYFKCAYLNNIDNLINKLKFDVASSSLQSVNI